MDRTLVLDSVKISKNKATLVAVDAMVEPGKVLTLMGPSGSGKSTLLSFITGTMHPAFDADGEVLLHGQPITTLPANKRRVGIMFQDDLLFPHLSVGQNLAFGLAPGGTRVSRRQKIEAALEGVGLAGFVDRDPATLSGGQRARVALMRMLLAAPCALLLDEAFSRLDQALRGQVREMVFRHAKTLELPVLMVTHDVEDAEAAEGQIIRLETDITTS